MRDDRNQEKRTFYAINGWNGRRNARYDVINQK
jgi:hypothetical protein